MQLSRFFFLIEAISKFSSTVSVRKQNNNPQLMGRGQGVWEEKHMRGEGSC